jgi:hypothetical protein
MTYPIGSPPMEPVRQLVGLMTTETSFAHVVRAHGMRLFCSKLMFLDPRGIAWTSWVLAVGAKSTEPQFCHAFLFNDTDPRVQVAGELLAVRKVFKEWVVDYYKDLTTH